MKAATGNALLMNVIIIFLVVVLSLIVTSISYTKAYRVKNRIIEIIEDYNGNFAGGNIMTQINSSLTSIGYRHNNGKQCPTLDNLSADYAGSDYLYCIYTYNSDRGKYYKVIAYMYLDLPIIGSYLNFPIYGETKVFYE